MMLTALLTSALLLLGGRNVAAIELDIQSDASIRSVASTLAFDMMSEYKGNLSGMTPGLLPGPPPNPAILNQGYFWWEAGAMFGTLLDYWYYTNDTSYNDVIYQAMLHQVGENQDYLPQNQSNGMGNDDQGFWGMTAMTAAELNFQNPPPDEPQWLALAQAVFNSLASRLDDKCGGGLRWQAYIFLNGYDYKNSISNGCFFNLGARLAQYTKNATYASYAEQSWDWMTSVGFMDAAYNIYDGASIDQNCTGVNPVQFSYNAGVFLLGAATMYNYTGGSALWRNRTESLLNRTLDVFFPNDIGFEAACEGALVYCTVDMFSQKAFLTRWMAATTKVAPWSYEPIMRRLRTSAQAAAQQCCGGANGRRCGLSWAKRGVWDGTQGVGQQMAALEVVQSLLIKQAKETVTNETGGTSQGNPAAGGTVTVTYVPPDAVTTADKAGAAILTVLFVGGLLAMCSYMTFGK